MADHWLLLFIVAAIVLAAALVWENSRYKRKNRPGHTIRCTGAVDR